MVAQSDSGPAQHLVILMPLTDELGLAGYLQRLNDELRETLGEPMHRQLAPPRSLLVKSRQSASDWLTRVLGAEDRE